MGNSKVELDLHKLEIFFWVAELKSFSQAAEHLSLRQPTVSAHIQELEEALGGKLFYRIPGKVSLTPLGQLVVEKAKVMLACKRETVAAVEQFHGTLSGELWVGGSSIPGEYLLPPKLGAFVRQFPQVKPILRIGDSARIVEEILEGKVELGYVGYKGADARVSFRVIWQDEMVLAVPRDHPWTTRDSIALSSLHAEKFLSRESGSGTLDSFREILIKKGEVPARLLDVAMELGSAEAVKQALVSGFGVSILSRTSIKRELAEGVLVEVPIRGLKMERGFFEVVHRKRSLSPPAQAFREFLKQSSGSPPVAGLHSSASKHGTSHKKHGKI